MLTNMAWTILTAIAIVNCKQAKTWLRHHKAKKVAKKPYTQMDVTLPHWHNNERD